jgi:hypothetical protein
LVAAFAFYQRITRVDQQEKNQIKAIEPGPFLVPPTMSLAVEGSELTRDRTAVGGNFVRVYCPKKSRLVLLSLSLSPPVFSSSL